MSEENVKDFAAEGGEALLFSIDDVVYGIEIKYVSTIINIEQITKVPKVPEYIKGVINLRGKIVPVISVRNRFGKEEIPYDERTCIIILEFDDGNLVGIIVDRMREVTTVRADEICLPPDFKNVNTNKYIRNIIESNGEIKQLLDCEKLISDI